MLRASARLFSSSAPAAHKVAVLGAAGGIGQPLSLLLKTLPGARRHCALALLPAAKLAPSNLRRRAPLPLPFSQAVPFPSSRCMTWRP